MPSDLKAPEKRIRKPRTDHGKRLRRLRRYYKAAYPSLSESIYQAAPGIDVFDHQRILELLARNMDASFVGKEDRRSFNRWALEWTQRAARLTAHVKAMRPALELAAQSVFPFEAHELDDLLINVSRNIDQYRGELEDATSLAAWATDYMKQSANGVVAFYTWIKKHRRSIRSGLWSVMKRCGDLIPGQPGTHKIIGAMDELESDVWFWVRDHAVELLRPGSATLKTRLRARAAFIARAWKSKRLRETDGPLPTVVSIRELHFAPERIPTAQKPSLNEIESRAA